MGLEKDGTAFNLDLSQLYFIKNEIRRYKIDYTNAITLLKQYSEKIDNLSELVEKEINPNVKNFKNWSGKRVVNFIVSLNDEYVQYKDELLKQFEEQNFNGAYLPELEKNDLIQFGIKDFGHRTKIYKALKSVASGTFGSTDERKIMS